jgi:autotransporter adhesin
VATGSGNVVSVGAVGAERQIQNLAAGAVTVTSTDAVNGSQLFGVATSVAAVGAGAAAGLGGGSTYNPATGAFTGPSYALNGSGTTFTNAVSGIQAIASGAAGPVQYATPGTPSSNLNLVGTGAPVTLGNVAAGALTPTSTEAVNGSQLYATNQQVNTNTQNIVTTNQRTAAALGGGAGVDGNGLLTAPSYTVQGGTFNNVGGAISAIDRGLSNSVQYDTTASGDPNRQSITLNPGAGPVTIHNVAAGVALTDAANVGQVAAAVANTVQYGTNPNGTRSNTLALVGGDTSAPVRISNVASGVAATDAVNLGQLDAVANNLTGAYNNLAAIGSYQFQSAKRAAYAGTAIALAAAGLRYDDRPGKVSLAAGASGYHGTAGLAAGLGGTSEDGSLRYHVAASFSPNERKASAGIFGGLSFTLNSSDNAPSY